MFRTCAIVGETEEPERSSFDKTFKREGNWTPCVRKRITVTLNISIASSVGVKFMLISGSINSKAKVILVNEDSNRCGLLVSPRM